MKKLEAIIRRGKLEALQHELEELGFVGMTVTEVRGVGDQAGHLERYRDVEFRAKLLPKVKVELVVSDTDAPEVLDRVVATCRTGEVGDGKIYIWSLTDAVRIRTGERGAQAL